MINTNGTLIDLVQLNDDNESVEIKADGEKLLDSSTANESVESGSSGSEATADETPQVAVVQSPGGGTPQYITVTGKWCCSFFLIFVSISQLTYGWYTKLILLLVIIVEDC